MSTPGTQTYRCDGFVVVGVHTPEYAFEHVPANVQAGAQRLGITYPVAIDNSYATWNAYGNNSWPAEYLLDTTGQVRHIGVGEGGYQTTETLIRNLLLAAHPGITLPRSPYVADATPTEQTTPETYLGSQLAHGLAGSSPLTNGTAGHTFPATVPDDEFALTGTWTASDESITAGAGAAIKLNFQARQVYLDVSGTGTATVTLSGKTTDYPISGAPNIHTIVDQATPTRRTVLVSLSPGLAAYSFTFG